MPRLCMIFEAIGPYSAIGRIAEAEVEASLDAGWQVSVVSCRLADSLIGRVEWLNLYNPPRGFALKWLTARHFIRKAMGDVSRFDLIHGHQPQIADLCDVFECHYLTRAAMERGCRDPRRGWRGKLARAQESIVLRAEDRCYRSWNPETELVCDSELTLQEFGRLYGLPPRHDVQMYPAPPWDLPSVDERVTARATLAEGWSGPVAGFLGGMSERKGCAAALQAVAAAQGWYLLLAGSHGDQVQPPPDLEGRYCGLGVLKDVRPFFAAIDVLLVPSVFEPFGLVCTEAVSHGVPVLATASVGALPLLEQHNVGRRWNPTDPLESAARPLLTDADAMSQRCQRLISDHTPEHFADVLLRRYGAILNRKTRLKKSSMSMLER